MKPHLLYIAFWFPPSRASGVYRALAACKAFVDAGWDVTVATANVEFLSDEIGSLDQSLTSEIPPEVEVTRVPFAFDLVYSTDVRRLNRISANFPTMWSAAFRVMAPVRRARAVLKGASPESHQIGDKYVAWIDPVVKTAVKAHSKRPFDHILATGNPYSAFEAARLISDLTDVGFSIDYRDPWTVDVFTGDPDFGDHTSTTAEARIMSAASLSFHVNEAIADAYRLKYPADANKQRVVHNGFDTSSIPPPPRPLDGPPTFGILGTVNQRWPTRPIFDAWAALRSEVPPGSRLILGGHLGYFAHSADTLEAYLPDESLGFQYIGPVPKAQVASFYESIDIVVLPVPGGSMVSSGKVFEAMALGKPIVCVQTAGGGARSVLADHPLTFAADPDAESVRSAMLQAIESAVNLDEETSDQIRKSAEPFERSLAITPMVEAITHLKTAERSS